MAESIAMNAQQRQKTGSQHVRRLRKQGQLPAILYGHKQDNVPLTVSAEEFGKALKRGARILNLQTDGQSQTVLIRDVQWDHLGLEVLHVDFERISAEERIEVDVRIEAKGTAPGVTAGGVLEQVMHSVTVECLAMSVPDGIRVNIGNLQMDEAILVKDLSVGEGVKVLANPDEVVFHIVTGMRAPEEEAGAPAAEQAEPEIIKRPKAEEEGE